MLTLRRLGADDGAGYLAMIEDFMAAGEGYPYNDADTARSDFTAFLADLDDEATGDNLPAGCPRQLTYLLVDGSEVLSEFRFRPYIEAPFERYHGHIAYHVRPTARGRGRATRGLALMLDEARSLGLDEVTLTVDDPNNVGSVRVIQRNGGRLVQPSGERTAEPGGSYRIEL